MSDSAFFFIFKDLKLSCSLAGILGGGEVERGCLCGGRRGGVGGGDVAQETEQAALQSKDPRLLQFTLLTCPCFEWSVSPEKCHIKKQPIQ